MFTKIFQLFEFEVFTLQAEMKQNLKRKKGKFDGALQGGKAKNKSDAPHQLLVKFDETSGKWFENQIDETRPAESKPDGEVLRNVQSRAEELLNRETTNFAQRYRSRNRSDADWLETVAHKGTFADRLSALQLRVRRSPVHALKQLREFVELVTRKADKIRQSYSITKALKELFLSELLPPNRKLIPFSQRPFEKWADEDCAEAQKRLILWYFEGTMKQCYLLFVEGLKALSSSAVEGVAIAACAEMAELLAARPEQEQNLLSTLVNRLGHPQHRIGSKVANLIERHIFSEHPNMRPIVAKELEGLLFRKNISPRAQHYALHLMSRMELNAGEDELALQLIQTYLRLFRILVVKDALEEHQKLVPLIVTGLNRAFPYAGGRTSELMDDVESFYTIVQTAKFSVALSVLRLLFQIHSTSDGLSDRFYNAFYRRLLNVQPSSHDSKFFTLTRQILVHDLVEARVQAMLKRLFQVALSATSAFAAQTLLTVNEVVKERPSILRVDLAWLEGSKGNKEHRQTTTLVNSFSKETEKNTKLQWFEENCDDEEEERYEDVDEDRKCVKMNDKRGWIHHTVVNNVPKRRAKGKLADDETTVDRKLEKTTPSKGRHSYDPAARNPLFAGAQWSMDTELYSLAHHYHPTVASFAQALIKGQPIHYRGDPLIDLSQMRFLDRFAFKNPKQRKTPENGTKKTMPLFANAYTPTGVKALNPVSQDYISKKTTEIPLDERFLHHFASLKFKRKNAAEVKSNKGEKDGGQNDDDAEEVASLNSDEFDMLMERFEPGESREVFDVDFATEFGDEADSRVKRKALKRRMVDEEQEEDDDGLAGSDISENEADEDEDEFGAGQSRFGADVEDEEDNDMMEECDNDDENEEEEEELEFD